MSWDRVQYSPSSMGSFHLKQNYQGIGKTWKNQTTSLSLAGALNRDYPTPESLAQMTLAGCTGCTCFKNMTASVDVRKEFLTLAQMMLWQLSPSMCRCCVNTRAVCQGITSACDIKCSIQYGQHQPQFKDINRRNYRF